MSSNVHGLLHLPEVVTKLGPLWAHSCFPFEAANGKLLKMFHGSQAGVCHIQELLWTHMQVSLGKPHTCIVFLY